MRKVRGILELLVTLETPHLREITFSVRVKLDGLEPDRAQHASQHRTVVEELVSPAVKGPVDPDAVELRVIVRDGIEPVMRSQHPIEIGRRNAKSAVTLEHAAALPKEEQTVIEGQVFEEVLGVNRGGVLEWEAEADIKSVIDAAKSRAIDVYPSAIDVLSATDMQADRIGKGRKSCSLPEGPHVSAVFTTVVPARSVSE
jgi:hypothetical protein